MIGWIFIAVAKTDRVLRGDSMMTIEPVINAVRSKAATASHCRTREHQRKCGYTNQSEVDHNTFSFQTPSGRLGMSNSSRVTLQCDRKRLMPAGIEHMLVHLTGPHDLLTSLDVDRVPARSK